ncbi:MAG: DUF3124 domain-containing protein [Proteobacteria bacterium]|nr:DUF3124 domain-containing protein [Pseudomonadota bacterium]MBU1140838.1 DUF3124 domain-containing protein [Pseudomonadota bacterium]MBU1232550.1 DUF3124 domain-containing protein [Pseudomonadota bacterium]MBU1418012.1 DUF3124 domain-containing protein [Pseudomonadota bacterium]MBU1455937.1 DUF3124 domain-containing protein [Pseudomonadota bacterium]
MIAKTCYRFSTLLITFSLLFLSPQASSALTVERWLAQTVYVPVYSHIYADSRFKDKPFQLTAIVSIRNTDQHNSFTLEKVDYYDSHGKLLQHYLAKPLIIGPLASTRYIVPESDTLGGSGAKFIVSWSSKDSVTEPIIEGVMIGTKMQQGISFVTNSQVLSGTKAD